MDLESNYSVSEIESAMDALGIGRVDIKVAFENEIFCDYFKKRVKKNYKKAASVLHPDKNNGDEEKTNLFKLVTRIAEEVEKIEVVRKRWTGVRYNIHFKSTMKSKEDHHD